MLVVKEAPDIDGKYDIELKKCRCRSNIDVYAGLTGPFYWTSESMKNLPFQYRHLGPLSPSSVSLSHLPTDIFLIATHVKREVGVRVNDLFFRLTRRWNLESLWIWFSLLLYLNVCCGGKSEGFDSSDQSGYFVWPLWPGNYMDDLEKQ